MRMLVVAVCLLVPSPALAQLRVATFECDASPPVGSPMAYDPTKAVSSPLSCRGIVILGAEKPIVLCSVDWLGIANASHTEFCERLAKAAGTTPDRVSVHTIHQHDAPRCDFSAKEYLDQVGLGDAAYDERFCRSVFLAAAQAVVGAIKQTQPVTHVGIGEAIVEKVASNRRILGDDGKVKFTRYTACRDPKIRAMPVGTIDPSLKMVSFWNGDKPVAVLTYYATHPQSYYRTGEANPDFPGMARNDRQKETGVPHIHFNGAGGNIGAGKWNDGSKENRGVLADRVALGMKQAWEATTKTAVTAEDVAWKSLPVVLPAGEHLVEDKLVATLKDESLKQPERLTAAKHLAWLKRTKAKTPVNLSLLSIGKTRVLHMPGELFVEYQLAAQEMDPDNFVAMAAYGEYGTGYIGTKIAYSQGGYETSERASRVSSDVEEVLNVGMKKLLAGVKTVEIRGDVYLRRRRRWGSGRRRSCERDQCELLSAADVAFASARSAVSLKVHHATNDMATTVYAKNSVNILPIALPATTSSAANCLRSSRENRSWSFAGAVVSDITSIRNRHALVQRTRLLPNSLTLSSSC